MTQLSDRQTSEDTEDASHPDEGMLQRGKEAVAQVFSHPSVNVGDGERAVSVAAGAILAALGISRRSLSGLLVAGVGGAMVHRGLTGHCHAYDALGLNTADGSDGRSEADEIAKNGVQITQAFIINKPAADLYRFWRDFSNLPKIMSHLESVQVQDDRRSHWTAKAQGLGGKRFEWDAEVVADVPDQRIAWRSLPGADVQNSGEIRFSRALGDRGTDVHVSMAYVPPAGRIGHWIASLLGNNPKRVVREDLRNFKRIMEIGEILKVDGQSRGTCTGQGEFQSETPWRPLFT